jgi:Concanavalin A-like lectin/glucanases superfamily
MARYGATPLEIDQWYHVAGVYDAERQVLNVYLNGQLDNGCLLGTVTQRQTISGVNTYVGRRGVGDGYEFAGSIDDVRIYSRALDQAEIEADMRTGASQPVSLPAKGIAGGERERPDTTCTPRPEADAKVSGLVVTFGLLVAFACAGLWPTAAYRWPCLALSLGAGFLLVPVLAVTLPAYYYRLIPLLTLIGGAAAVCSTRSSDATGDGS